MLNNPEPGLTPEQAEVIVGQYYAKNIIGHYTPEQINLAMFMVNLSHLLIRHFRPNCPAFSVIDLKAHFRGHKYVTETLKLLPQLPEPIFIDRIFANIAQIGSINLFSWR